MISLSSNQLKTMKKLLILLFSFIKLISLSASDCEVLCFRESYSKNIEKEDVSFFRAIKLETIYHGMKIRVLDNFKANSIGDTIEVLPTFRQLTFKDTFDFLSRPWPGKENYAALAYSCSGLLYARD